MKRFSQLTQTASEADLVAGNFLAIDVPGAGGATKKLPGKFISACKLIDRGEASVAIINALTFKQDGWKFILTDDGILTLGSLAVRAGDCVAWNATSSKWYMINQEVSKTYVDTGISNEKQNPLNILYGFPSGEFSCDKSGLCKFEKANSYDGRWVQVLFNSSKVEIDMHSACDFVVLASKGVGIYNVIAVAVKGTHKSYLFTFANSTFTKASTALADFPTFDLNDLTIVDNGDYTYHLSDGVNEYDIDLTASEFDPTGMNTALGLIFDKLSQIGMTFNLLNWRDFECPEQIAKIFESEEKAIALDNTLNTFGIISSYAVGEYAIDGNGVVSLAKALFSSPKIWTYCLVDADKISLNLTYIPNYIILAIDVDGDDFTLLAIALNGSQAKKWCKFTRSTFTGSSVISDFPTFNLTNVVVQKVNDTTYTITDGTLSYTLDLTSQNLVDTSKCEKRIGIVAHSGSQLNTDLFKFNDLSELETYKKISLFVSTKVKPVSLVGKKIAILGDSITANNLFPNALAQISGATILNYGISGSTISSLQNKFVDRVSGMSTDADFVLVFGGVNDWQKGASLGQFSDGSSQGSSTFYSALFTLMDALKEKYQNASIFKKIVFMTPLHCNYTGSPNKLEWEFLNGALVENSYGGSVLSNYVKAIKEVAEFNALPVIDSHAISDLMPYNANNRTKFFSDGLHPNATGAQVLAKAVYANILKYFE